MICAFRFLISVADSFLRAILEPSTDTTGGPPPLPPDRLPEVSGQCRTSTNGRQEKKCYVMGIIGDLVGRHRITADAKMLAGCEGHGGTNVHVDPQDCSGAQQRAPRSACAECKSKS